MTSLNTIIEEEKDKIFCKYDFGYMDGTTVGVIEDLNNDLATAMQRAYEAGEKKARADWLWEAVKKLEGDKQPNQSVSEYYSGYNTALTSIITRYKEELLELDKTNGL